MDEPRKLPFSLYGLPPEALCEVLSLPQAFSGKQIFRWLARGISDFRLMTDLPKAERERLALLMPNPMSSRVETEDSDESGATKLAVRLFDGAVTECVLLTDDTGRRTACLSSQVGCAMGCTFCRTGTMGLVRNLAAEEIIEQFVHLSRTCESPVTHIVYMGMGEPMANFKAVIRSVRYFHDPAAFDISMRRMTISTCGVVPGILKLAEQKLPIRLAVSLVSADDALRSRIMPVNDRWDLTALKKALLRYRHTGGKRITFEYCMLKGTNTDERSAEKLASYTRGLDVLVNLIPWNPVGDLPWQTPDEREIASFASALDRLGVTYSRRYSRGRTINGACGQLAVPLNERN